MQVAGKWVIQKELTVPMMFELSLRGNSGPRFTKSAEWALLADWIFQGSNRIGSPKTIKVIAYLDTAGATGSFMVWDRVNMKTVASFTGLTSTVTQIVDLGPLSNIPEGETIFELYWKIDKGAIYATFLGVYH